ncbi:hypothetical protein [Pseudochryseolinea flava]|uniref:Uncharacterized protein n=1 Tax=Pseudochryseolinea flava TaxID=2059302 RepID=A0A364XXS9_9BACT|nr:hypothetical protein [Pseudochryseolinea flava]RAV98224.1 hypothetical protein DQQ10_24800 [Pseudochryseolinea flava]
MFRLAILLFVFGFHSAFAQVDSIGFLQWRTGHDAKTAQLIPAEGNDPIVREGNNVWIHVKFNVYEYGEVSFPIDRTTRTDEEAKRVDLSDRKYVKLTYTANQQVILQLRQTGEHGGVHNHVILPPVERPTSIAILLKSFKGGKSMIDLTDVAKFNFAFLSNNKEDGYAELLITQIVLTDHK